MNRERRQREGLDANVMLLNENGEHRGGSAGVPGKEDRGGVEGHAKKVKLKKSPFIEQIVFDF